MVELILNHLKVLIAVCLTVTVVSGIAIAVVLYKGVTDNVNDLKHQNVVLAHQNLRLKHQELRLRHQEHNLRLANFTACYNSNLSRLQSNNFTYLLFVNYQQGVDLDKSLINNPTIRQIYTPAEIRHLIAQAAALVNQFVLLSPVRCTGQLKANYHSPEPIHLVNAQGLLTPQAKHVVAIGSRVLHSHDPGEAVRQLFR